MKIRKKKPGRFAGQEEAPATDEDGLSHTRGPDGLIHHDCPMERGVEPCRCGARPLAHQEDPS